MSYDVAIVLGYSAISFIMAYLAMNTDREEHGIIQIFFMFLSLYGTWGVLGAIQGILEVQGITQLQGLNIVYMTVLFWATWLVLGYILIMFIWNTFDVWKKKKDEKRGKGGPPQSNIQDVHI